MVQTVGAFSYAIRTAGMSDCQAIDQQAHDLLDEANLLIMELALSGADAAAQSSALVIRLRDCATQAAQGGRDKSARHLHEVAAMIESEVNKLQSPAPNA